MRLRIPLLAVLTALIPACSGGQQVDQDQVLVLAAASLSQAMPALIEAYRAEGGAEIELVLGSTGNLAAQIENGAPADLFFAADVETVERLVGTGRIDAASVTTYGRGQLAILARDGGTLPATIQSLSDPSYQVIAIANPEHAPYGAAAQEAMERAGVWEAVQSRVVFGENVAQAYQLARTGNADVAIVARSVLGEGDEWGEVDTGLYTPIDQAAGVTAGQQNPEARAFLDFVLSPRGQSILAENGFAPAAD